MFADLKYNRKRRLQVNKLLGEKEMKMRDIFGDRLSEEILQVSSEAFERRSNRIRDQQSKIFDSLIKEYGITDEELIEGEERLKRRRERERSRLERRLQDKQQQGLDDLDKGDLCKEDPVETSNPQQDKESVKDSTKTAAEIEELIKKLPTMLQETETNSEI